MAGRNQRFVLVATLIVVAASCLYFAASGDPGKPADKSRIP